MQWDNYWTKEKLKFHDFIYDSGKLHIKAEMISLKGSCPSCGQESGKVHSHYERSIADLPCFGAFCELSLLCRRFFCANESCNRTIFCERLGSVAKAYARKSSRLMKSIKHVGFKVASYAATQLCNCLGIATSATALDRYLRSHELQSFETPRVLGIDDWAMCKGRTYGTLLVDLEKQKPIDILEGRDASVLAEWLKDHPKIEIISRDRSGEYALAVNQGALQAIEIADRWHLLKNLREMIERYFQGNTKTIQLAYQKTLELKGGIHVPEPNLSSRKELEKQEKRQKRLGRFDEVHKLHQQGFSNSQIAKQLGMSRGTVIKYLASKEFPEQQARGSRLGKLKPFIQQLNQRFVEGCHNINQLWCDIQEKGYEGKRAMVKRYVHYLKSPSKEQLNVLACPRFRKPTPKLLSYALLKPTEFLAKDMQNMFEQLSLIANDFEAFKAKSIAFDKMIKER